MKTYIKKISALIFLVFLATECSLNYNSIPFKKKNGNTTVQFKKDEVVIFGDTVYSSVNKHNHGPSIAELKNGDLIAVWSNGTSEKTSDDLKILGSRLKKGSNKWSEAFVVHDTQNFPDLNPVIFTDNKDRLWIFFYTLISNTLETSLLKYMVSNDYSSEGVPKWERNDIILVYPGNFSGKKIQKDDKFLLTLEKKLQDLEDVPLKESTIGPMFSEYKHYITSLAKGKTLIPSFTLSGNIFARELNGVTNYPLMRRIGWQTRDKPMQINNRIILPVYSNGFKFSMMLITEDDGKSWETSEPLVSEGAIEPSIIFSSSDNSITSYMSDTRNVPKAIQYSESKDLGETWSTVKYTKLPNNASSVSIDKLSNGHWVLAYNDTVIDNHALAVAISADEGKSWKYKRHVYVKSKSGNKALSPTIKSGKDDKIHLIYSTGDKSSNEEKIIYFSFNEDWVKQGD